MSGAVGGGASQWASRLKLYALLPGTSDTKMQSPREGAGRTDTPAVQRARSGTLEQRGYTEPETSNVLRHNAQLCT